jgi:hypothetical protein
MPTSAGLAMKAIWADIEADYTLVLYSIRPFAEFPHSNAPAEAPEEIYRTFTSALFARTTPTTSPTAAAHSSPGIAALKRALGLSSSSSDSPTTPSFRAW